MSDNDFSMKEIVLDIRDTVRVLDEKVDALPTQAQAQDHERRIRSVEKRVWALPAGTAAVAGAVGAALTQLGVL
jgi:hypothetical protein|tara:strand:- start:2691 stop:2912 length:222 start_codon:yes stop_codon:yes gene_type:complete